MLVRENTEDLYAGIEHEVVPEVMVSMKVITEVASMRIARFAFDYAQAARAPARDGGAQGEHHEDGRRPLPRLHAKGGRRSTRSIDYDERIVDAACMHLVMRPETFDVLVMPNLYGDIVSDLCAGLVGGLGVVGSANLGEDMALFEAVHGTAPDIAGRDLANPTALLLSALMMLRHIGEAGGGDPHPRRPRARAGGRPGEDPGPRRPGHQHRVRRRASARSCAK